MSLKYKTQEKIKGKQLLNSLVFTHIKWTIYLETVTRAHMHGLPAYL